MGNKFCGCNDHPDNKAKEANLVNSANDNQNDETKEKGNVNAAKNSVTFSTPLKDSVGNNNLRNSIEQNNMNDSLYKVHDNDYTYSQETHSEGKQEENNEFGNEMQENAQINSPMNYTKSSNPSIMKQMMSITGSNIRRSGKFSRDKVVDQLSKTYKGNNKYFLDDEFNDENNENINRSNDKVKLRSKNRKNTNDSNDDLEISRKSNTIKDKNQSLFDIPLVEDKHEIITLIMYNNSFGQYIRKNGDRYIGEIVDKKANGRGKLTKKEKGEVAGYFSKDYYNGYIQMNLAGSTYEGESSKGCYEGIGIAHYDDGNSYYGEFKRNNKSGIGTFKWANGAEYQGEFFNNKLEGYGTYKFPDGKVYEGEFSDGMFNGIGCLYYLDGKKYIGMFQKDKRTGFGILLWKKNLKIYIGFFKNGKQNGFGKIIESHKETYAMFLDGKKAKTFTRNEFFEEIKNNKKESVNTFAHFFNIDLEETINILG